MTVTTRKALDRVGIRSAAQNDSAEQEWDGSETFGLAAGPGSRPEAETGATHAVGQEPAPPAPCHLKEQA